VAAAQALAFDPDQVLRGFGFDGTVRELLASRLGVNLPADHRFAGVHITLPDDDVQAGKMVRELEDVIVGHGREEPPHLVAYLREAGVDRGSAAVVDIGYSATIQRHLQAVTGRGLTGFYFGTLAGADAVKAGGGSAYGCFAEGVPRWTVASPFHRHSILLEAFLTAPEPQVERVVVDGDRPVHRFREEVRTAEELDTVRQLHAGATRYVDDLLASFGPAIVDVPVDPAVVLNLVTMVAQGQLIAPSVTSKLVVDDDFCGTDRRMVMAAGRVLDPPGVT